MKSLMRKIVCLIFLGSFTIPASANICEAHFLLGVDGGVATRDGDFTINITHPGVQTTVVENHENTGFIFGFFAGYEAIIQEFLVGIELNLGFQDFGKDKDFQFTDLLQRSYGAKFEHERHPVFGLTVRGGYRLAPWIIAYVRAGAEFSKEIVRLQALSNVGLAPAISVGLDDGRDVVRFIGGMGFEFPVTRNTNVRLEYNYSSRGRGASESQIASDGTTIFDVGFKPNQHAFKLAFAWNFDFSYLLKDRH